MKDYPTSKETYWQIVDANWSNLIDIISRFAFNRVKAAERARLTEDVSIVDIFQEVWNNAPDSPSLHYIPSWNILCDLCSESYVLFDDKGNAI